MVHGVMMETTEAVRTDFEVYKVVLEAAEAAAADAETAAAAAARMDAGRGGNLAELQARADTAKAAYERADRSYEEAVSRKPGRLEPRKTAGENVGRFLEGLNSLAAGDRAGAERSAEEMGRAREAALLDAEAANAAATAVYEDAVSRAREARATAHATYRAAAAAAERAAVDAAGSRAERVSAFEDYEVALSAQRTAFVNASRVARVYEEEELNEVTRALMAGALSAIVELETEVLARITRDAAREAVEAALATFSEPRLAALAPLGSLEAEYLATAEAALMALIALESAEASNQERVVDARRILQRIESTYWRTVHDADKTLDDALVASFRRTAPRDRKGAAMRTDAATAYRLVMEGARLSRRQDVDRAFPNMDLPQPRHPVLSAGDWGTGPVLSIRHWSAGVASSVTDYRRKRAGADARYREAILSAVTTNTGALAAEARSTAVTRDAARDAYDAAFAAAQAAISFDYKARARLPTLEADVRAALVAAAHAPFSEGSLLKAQARSPHAPNGKGRPTGRWR